MKVSVIIPSYNEAARIGRVLGRIKNVHEVIVVDDGSTDRTYKEAEKFGARVVRLRKNLGKAKACIEGLNRSRHEYCVFIDGDAQFYPEEIPKIAGALKDHDIVIGVRNSKSIPVQRRLTNWLARKSVKLITGSDFPDVLCGFRGVRKKSFRRLSFEKEGYFFESEMALGAAKHGMKISFVPVKVDYEHGAKMGARHSLELGIWLAGKCAGKIFQDCSKLFPKH